ncbi:MAG TPA: hypothetical protein VGK64_00280 [Bryobacteraceae bacterium]
MDHSESRRTTLTLSAKCLKIAERIARERRLNLSSVVGEALERGLREEEQAQRSEAILHAYSKAFGGFSADELLVLDGVVREALPVEKLIPKRRRIRNGVSRARK